MEDKNLEELQSIEHTLQHYLAQKQNFQSQLVEINSAIKELNEKKDDVYKIIGNIMVKTNSKNLLEELNKKKEIINLRINTIEKQEEELKKKAEEIQKKIIGDKNGSN